MFLPRCWGECGHTFGPFSIRVDAPPDNLPPPVDAPRYPAVSAAAVPADQPFGEGIFAGELSAVGFGVLLCCRIFAFSPGDFLPVRGGILPWKR